MNFILTIIFFIFGTIIGSFLNVVIFRFNTKKTLGGRSKCLSCERELAWYDLVPVLSYMLLSGRCRVCRSKISGQYPSVELATGLIFAGLFLKFQYLFYISTSYFSVTYAYYAMMFSLLLVIAVYDLRHKIIPDILSFTFGALALVGVFFFTSNGIYEVFGLHMPGLWDFLSGLVIAVPFALLWFISKGAWMGLGDAKLAVGLGLLLGVGRLLSGAVVAFWAGAIIGIFLILSSKKYGMKSEIPFAPFLVLGSILAFLLELHFFPMGS